MPRWSPLEPYFWAKVDRTGGPDACWPWLGNLDRFGYGRCGVVLDKKIERRAYRAAFRLEVGPIPAGLSLDHLCRNPRCVNPKHLEPVTRAENTRRQRMHFTDRGGQAKINAEKTHCKHGHPFAGDNLRITSQGGRECRRCRSALNRRNAETRRPVAQ